MATWNPTSFRNPNAWRHKRSGRRGLYACLMALLAFALQTGCPEIIPADLAHQPAGQGVHLLRFAHLSDPHLIDEESPARMVRADGLIAPAWRPQEDYSAAVLDATLQVVNAYHNAGKASEGPIDFVIVTGDAADSGQYNELRWFIDTMDGQTVSTDSGAPDGAELAIAPEDNPKLEYDALGLDPDIPWYTAYGNHDGLAAGNFGVQRYWDDPGQWDAPLLQIVASVVGLRLLDGFPSALVPTLDRSPAVLRPLEDRIDPDTLQLDIGALDSGPIVPDPRRHYVSKPIFIQEHFNTVSLPEGHGYSAPNPEAAHAGYSVRPKEDVPVRLLVIDTVPDNPPYGLPVPFGVLTRQHFNALVKPEIEAARTAGEFVLLASHHPAADFDIPYPITPTLTAAEFRGYLADQPHIIAHIAGHSHRNYASIVAGPNPYYEIETGSLIDYPQEGRILDIFYDEATGAIRLESTMISHMEQPTRLSSEGYRRATIDAYQAKNAKSAPDIPNVDELFPYTKSLFGDGYKVSELNGWAPPPTPQERYGRDQDRNFASSLPRPKMQHLTFKRGQ